MQHLSRLEFLSLIDCAEWPDKHGCSLLFERDACCLFLLKAKRPRLKGKGCVFARIERSKIRFRIRNFPGQLVPKAGLSVKLRNFREVPFLFRDHWAVTFPRTEHGGIVLRSCSEIRQFRHRYAHGYSLDVRVELAHAGKSSLAPYPRRKNHQLQAGTALRPCWQKARRSSRGGGVPARPCRFLSQSSDGRALATGFSNRTAALIGKTSTVQREKRRVITVEDLEAVFGLEEGERLETAHQKVGTGATC